MASNGGADQAKMLIFLGNPAISEAQKGRMI
jgi:hypothetical protein